MHNYQYGGYQHTPVVKPDVLIERHVWAKMFGWCRAAKSEVSGYGLVREDDGQLRVYDVFFPKQYCSSGYTEIDDKANLMLQKKLFQRGKISSTQNDYLFWWHTHYNFGTFWSGTDDFNAKNLVKYSGTWGLSLVINQKGDHLCRLDSMRRFGKTIDTIDNLDVYLTQNSQFRKRKRNFKSDINRWVHALSELPESQKSRGLYTTNEGPSNTTTALEKVTDNKPTHINNYDSMESWYSGYNGYNNRSWEGFDYRDKNTKAEEKEDKKEILEAEQCQMVTEEENLAITVNKTEEEPKKEETPLWHKENADRFAHTARMHSGRWMLYNGKWIGKEVYDRLVSCWCGDGSCLNCLEYKGEEANERTV